MPIRIRGKDLTLLKKGVSLFAPSPIFRILSTKVFFNPSFPATDGTTKLVPNYALQPIPTEAAKHLAAYLLPAEIRGKTGDSKVPWSTPYEEAMAEYIQAFA
jgi:hypothetical protein